MSVLDFIKIKGFDGEPGVDAGEYFEIFQGSSAATTTSGDAAALTLTIDTTQPISGDAESSAALWAAQISLIEGESAYLAELNAIFQQKQAAAPTKINAVWNFMAEVGEWFVGRLAYVIAIGKTGGNVLVAEIASFLVEVGTSIALDALRTFLQKGQEICSAIRAENAALLTLENSLKNYELRREAMKLHTEQIENMLHHISMLEQQIVDTLSGEESSNGEMWEDWVEGMDESFDGVVSWLDTAFAAADVDYDDDETTDYIAVPQPPALPMLPPTNDPKLIAFWMLMRFGTKVGVELIKKWVDKQHGKNHEEVIRLLKNLQRLAELPNINEVLHEQVEATHDLKYNDEMIDLGGIRIWHKNKVIEYG